VAIDGNGLGDDVLVEILFRPYALRKVYVSRHYEDESSNVEVRRERVLAVHLGF
jgi:hypothetical protein